MMMYTDTLENAVYLIANLFRIYTLYLFMYLFFTTCKVNRRLELTGYFIYFFINSAVCLMFDSPLLITGINIISLLILTVLYIGRVPARISATVLGFATNMLAEFLVWAYLVVVNDFHRTWTEDMILLVLSNLIFYVFVLIMRICLNRNSRLLPDQLGILHWAAILFIAAGSIVRCLFMLQESYRPAATTLEIIYLFALNPLILYLYHGVGLYYEQRNEQDMLRKQNEMYINQISVIREAEERVRALRHDAKNHIVTMQYLHESHREEELSAYFSRILRELKPEREFVCTGNRDMDCLLNYKLAAADRMGARIETEVIISEELFIDSYDMTVMVGNLLDNALEAMADCEDSYLGLVLRLEKNSLFLSIQNTCNKKLIKANEHLLTTKSDLQNHGIGMRSVERVVKKYGGLMRFSQCENLFHVEISLLL